jgi:hypothetical protein
MCCLLVAVNYYDYRNFNCVDCCSPVQAIFVYQNPFDYGSETGCRPYVHSFVECHVCSEVSVTVELIHSRYVPLSQCAVYVSADRCWYAVGATVTSIVNVAAFGAVHPTLCDAQGEAFCSCLCSYSET